MKKKVIKILVSLLILSSFYYIGTISLNINGQFVNYYYYPSSSIKESIENENFIKKLPINSIAIYGGDEFKKMIESDLSFWFDVDKVKRSFGIFSIFPYDTIDNDSKVLRVGYKDSKKRFRLSYDDHIWVAYNDNKGIQSISLTYGYFYKLGETAVIKFYDDEKRTKPLGTVKIKIE